MHSMNILGVIPARYASTRFPGKPLADLDGKSMIRRVYEQAKKSTLAKVIVATDDRRIMDHVNGFGGDVVMTGAHHASGTDRCREAAEKEPGSFDYVVNIQGDEPFLAPEQINLLASLLDGTVELATLIKPIDTEEALFNPNVVKVVVDAQQRAIYFSRSTIPYLRGVAPTHWHGSQAYYKHIGLYGYRTDTLKAITSLPVSPLEKSESLEQLRWIENGYKVKVAITERETIGIDTPEDLVSALAYLKTTRAS